jgi:SulP family sulfate permease
VIKVAEFQKIARLRSAELYWAFVALVGVIFLGTMQGIVIAIIASIGVICILQTVRRYTQYV